MANLTDLQQSVAKNLPVSGVIIDMSTDELGVLLVIKTAQGTKSIRAASAITPRLSIGTRVYIQNDLIVSLLPDQAPIYHV